jgi:hypothetical protein
MKEIISAYVNSSRPFFTDEILLNNLVINLGSKLKLIEFIIKEEEIEVDKEFTRWIRIALGKRNVLAYSDSVLDNFQIVDVDVEYEPDAPDGMVLYPIYEDTEPVAATVQNGEYKYDNVDKICGDFEKYYTKVEEELSKIATQVRSLNET